MVTFCCIKECENSSLNVDTVVRNVSFHRFPFRNPPLLQQWLTKINREQFTPSQNFRICSDHFADDSFIYRKFTKKKSLKDGAVPTIFFFQERRKRKHEDEEYQFGINASSLSSPPKEALSSYTAARRILCRQKGAEEIPEQAERRSSRAATLKASLSYDAQRRRIEVMQRQATCRVAISKKKAEQRKTATQRQAACSSAISNKEIEQRKIESTQNQTEVRSAVFGSLPEEESERTKVENAKKVTLMGVTKAVELSDQMQAERMGSVNQAWSDKEIISFPVYPVFNYESNPPIQVQFAQNQQLFQQNGWRTLMPNGIPPIIPSYPVRENSMQPNNIETPPPEIVETTTIVRSPKELGCIESVNIKRRGRKPGAKKPVPVKKMRLWEWAEMSKNSRGQNQPNNLKPDSAKKRTVTVTRQLDFIEYICNDQSKSCSAEVLPTNDETVQFKMQDLTDSSKQFENLQMLKNGCEGQPNNSTNGVHPVRDETVHIKMEYLEDSSEQLEKVEKLNGCGGEPNSSTNGVHPGKDETVQIKMDYSEESSEQHEKVEKLNCCGDESNSSTAEVLPEKGENVQSKMEFTVDSSEQLGNVEPWNMFTLELSTPSINIEKQKDVVTPISVSGSTSNTSDSSHKSDKKLSSFNACSDIIVDALKSVNLVSPISLNSDTQALVQEIEVLKAKDVLYAVENDTLKKKLKNLEKAYADSIKCQECLQEQIQEFEKNNRGMSNVILQIEKHNKALSDKLAELQNEKNVLTTKVCNLEKQNEDLTSKLKPSPVIIKIEPL